MHIEDNSAKKRPAIVITEFPYQTNKVSKALLALLPFYMFP